MKYCKWHNATSHSTNECKVFRQQLQSAIESGRIKFDNSKAQKPMKIDQHPFCNVLPPRGRARLHLAAFLGHRQPPQPNTSLFCTLCRHSCAPGKYFPVGHPSLNYSRPSMLNIRVLWRWAPGKEVATCWYESAIKPIKPWAGCYILTPIRDRRPRRSTPSQERPLLATSVHPVPAHMPSCVTTSDPHQPCTPCLRNCDTRAREIARVGSDTIL